MRATLRGAELATPVEATVGQAVPRVGNSSDVAPDHIAVQLTPADPDLVAPLVPGLRFEGAADTASGPPGRRGSVYVGR